MSPQKKHKDTKEEEGPIIETEIEKYQLRPVDVLPSGEFIESRSKSVSIDQKNKMKLF